MTDIRRHGFESAAQWREHLAEIEEVETLGAQARERKRTLRDLADLRADVEALRRSISSRGRLRRWKIAGAGLFLLLLFTAGWRA